MILFQFEYRFRWERLLVFRVKFLHQVAWEAEEKGRPQGSLLIRNALGEGAKCRSQVQNHPEGIADTGFLKLRISILTTRQDVSLASLTTTCWSCSNLYILSFHCSRGFWWSALSLKMRRNRRTSVLYTSCEKVNHCGVQVVWEPRECVSVDWEHFFEVLNIGGNRKSSSVLKQHSLKSFIFQCC